jgi:hypothetical protein
MSVMSHGSVVIIATAYGLDDRGLGVRATVGSRILISPYRPHAASYPMGTGGSFLAGKAAGGMKLTTHLQLIPSNQENAALYIHSLVRLHGVLLN